MASEKAERLRLALAAHRDAQQEYDQAEAALSLAATVLKMTRVAVEKATTAIKDEGVD
jgi:biotin operon repressor